MEEHNEYEEIDLSQLYHLIKSNLKYIILTALTGAVVALAFTIFFIDQEYASVASLYLKPKVVEGVVDSNGLTTNQKLVSDYMIIMKSDKVLTPVASRTNLSSAEEVRNTLSISADANSNIIKIKATTLDPKVSQTIVNLTISEFMNTVEAINEVDNIVILDTPSYNETAVAPNKMMNLIIGGLLGGMLAGGYVLLVFMMDKRLRNRNEVEKFLGIPVLGEIPYYED